MIILTRVMEHLEAKTVPQLQQFLKIRGVITTGLKKATLIALCKAAISTDTEVDPDGILDDDREVISRKLKTDDGESLPNPCILPGSANLSILPLVNALDIYNYFMKFDEYDHARLRDYRKMEGYTMYTDGYVLSVEAGRYENKPAYCFVKSQVKPRTREVDPVSKRKHYNCWIIMTSDPSINNIQSAHCTCKGG